METWIGGVKGNWFLIIGTNIIECYFLHWCRIPVKYIELDWAKDHWVGPAHAIGRRIKLQTLKWKEEKKKKKNNYAICDEKAYP